MAADAATIEYGEPESLKDWASEEHKSGIPVSILQSAHDTLLQERQYEDMRAAMGNPYQPPGPGLFPDKDSEAVNLARWQLREDLRGYYRYAVERDQKPTDKPGFKEGEMPVYPDAGHHFSEFGKLEDWNGWFDKNAESLRQMQYPERLDEGMAVKPAPGLAKDEKGGYFPGLTMSDILDVAHGTYKPPGERTIGAEDFKALLGQIRPQQQYGPADTDPNDAE